MDNQPITEIKKDKGWGNLIPAKKGEVRNPNGRPSNRAELTTILRKTLQDVPKYFDGKINDKKWCVLVTDALLKQAAKGNMRAVEIIFDRADGKLTQTIEGQIESKQATLIKIVWENGNEYSGRISLPGTPESTTQLPECLHNESGQAESNTGG